MEGIETIEKDAEFIEKLRERFPGAEVAEITLDDLPQDVLDHFEGKSSSLIKPEDYKPGNFKQIFLISYSEREKIYAAIQSKTYHNANTEELIYISETINDSVAGRGEIRFSTDYRGTNEEFFHNKPFVGFTQTEDELQGLHIGETRLRHMNEICLARYGFPLHSDTLMQKPAKRVWERLVESGEAEKFMEGNNERFRFKE